MGSWNWRGVGLGLGSGMWIDSDELRGRGCVFLCGVSWCRIVVLLCKWLLGDLVMSLRVVCPNLSVPVEMCSVLVVSIALES